MGGAALSGCAGQAAADGGGPSPSHWRTVAEQASSRVRAEPLTDRTCREVVRVTTGGSGLRLRLSNAGVAAPLVLRAVTVARRTTGAALDPASLRPVTVQGERTVTVPADGSVTTDPVELPVRPGTDLAVSLAVAGTSYVAEHLVGAATSACTAPGSGDRTAQTGAGGFVDAGREGLVVDGVDVRAPEDAPPGVLGVGDSLTDSTLPPDLYQRWTDRLAQDLGGDVAVGNAAIGGNRVLLAGGYGPTLEQRYARDVTTRSGVGTVVLLAGTNDVSGGVAPVALAAALGGLAAQAHAAGQRVVLVTLPPAWHRPARQEAVRLAVNAWVRRTRAADAVVDADALLRDPLQPTHLRPSVDIGDGLHLSVEGHRLLGDAVADALARLRR